MNFYDDCVDPTALLCVVVFLLGFEALLQLSTHHRGPSERLQSPQSHRHLD